MQRNSGGSDRDRSYFHDSARETRVTYPPLVCRQGSNLQREAASFGHETRSESHVIAIDERTRVARRVDDCKLNGVAAAARLAATTDVQYPKKKGSSTISKSLCPPPPLASFYEYVFLSPSRSNQRAALACILI